MRKPAWILAAATLTMASPALAQGVKIVPGEDVAFTVRNGQAIGVTRSGARANGFEKAVGAHFAGQKPPEAPVAQAQAIDGGESIPDAPLPETGKVHFRFVEVAGTDHAMLVVQNGYAQALTYRAQITVKGKASPTDVCLVMPAKSSVEHWPYAIAAIEVSGFELTPWKPEDGVPCK